MLYAIDGGVFNYSTIEHIVGRWVEDKPVYERTFTGTLDSTLHDVYTMPSDHFLVDCFGIIDYDETAIGGDTGYLRIPFTVGSLSGTSIAMYRESRVLKLTTNDDYLVGRTYIFTIRYTKTTDTVQYFEAGGGLIKYSLTECAIGKLANGKTVYSMTFMGNNPHTNATRFSVGNLPSVPDMVLSFMGFISWNAAGDLITLPFNDSTTAADPYYLENDSGVRINFPLGWDSNWWSGSYLVTVMYTKTE